MATTGLTRTDAEWSIHEHLGVCLDACHMAVEFEDVSSALGALRSAGIRIGKFQISAGLAVDWSGSVEGFGVPWRTASSTR